VNKVVQFPKDRLPVGAAMTQTLVRNLVSADQRAQDARKTREMRLHKRAMEAGRAARARGDDGVSAMMAAAFPANATLKVNVAGDMARGIDAQHNRDVYWRYFEAFGDCSFYVAERFTECEYRYQRQLAQRGCGNVLTIAKQARLILRFCRRYAPDALRPFVRSDAAKFPMAQA
jgi:hypothetical protein